MEEPIKECRHLKELLEAEMPALKIAYLHRQYLLEKDKGAVVSMQDAEKDFNERFFNSFCEGWKLCFCYEVCQDRENCEVKKSREKYEALMKKLEDSSE